MVLPSTQTVDLRTHLQKGAIYRDRCNNAIRLLSICGDYCVYVYVSLTGLRSSMHGSVTGLTRRDVFGASFVFVAGSVKDWMGNQRKHNALTPSSGIVSTRLVILGERNRTRISILSPMRSRQTITRGASHA